MQIIFSSIITVVLAITGVYAFNDWNVPCISGVCHYDLDHSKGGSSGTIQIWGSHKAISDITPAAGWHVLDCDEDEMEQVIRIVCVSQSAPCSHLFSHDGPEGKLIRMPEGCGRNPFARVAKAWVSYDQSLPRGLAAQLRKIDGLDPVAYNLALDVNFDAVDARHGPVRFAIQAATIPNTDTNIDTHLPLYKRSGRPVERSHKDIVARSLATVKRNILEHFHDAEQALNNAFNKAKLNVNKGAQTIKNHVVNAAATVEKDVPKVQAKINSVEKAAVEKAEKVKAAVKQDAKNVKATVEKDVPKVKAQIIHGEKAVVNAVEHPEATARKLKAGAIHGGKAFVKAVRTADANAHKLSNYNKTIHFSPQLSGHNTTLFKGTFNCKPMYPGLEVDLNPNGNMTGTIGIAASGTLIPPNLAEFRIVIDFSADVDAVLTINAELTILFDSGQHKLFGIPIAGIKIPGIFSIGPEFELLVQLRVLYDIAIGTRLGFGIQVENLHIELPKTQPMPHPKFKLTKGSFGLTQTPWARGTLQGDVHVVPTIALELDILGKIKTAIDIQADNMIVQKLVIEAEEKTKILKPRGFSEAETNSRNMLLDVGGLLSNIPLARSVTDLVLRFWRGSDPTNMDITSSPDAQNPLFRRLIPGPGPWPGGNGPLDNVDSSAGPVQNACIITYMIFDLSVGARDAFKLLGISFDQNTRISFWRKVNTLYYHCVGSNQPKGGFTINTIQSSLKNISSLWTRRSGEGNLIHPSFLGHKCDGVTMGSAMSNGLNPYSSVFAFSSTVPIGRKPN